MKGKFDAQCRGGKKNCKGAPSQRRKTHGMMCPVGVSGRGQDTKLVVGQNRQRRKGGKQRGECREKLKKKNQGESPTLGPRGEKKKGGGTWGKKWGVFN